MDEKDTAFAVKAYQKSKKKNPAYSYEDFLQEIKDHKSRRPMPHNLYDSFSLNASAAALWKILEMTMRDLVDSSNLDMAKFSRRFCIPYRTLQAWCDGTNPCPVYIKLMIAEILDIYKRTLTIKIE